MTGMTAVGLMAALLLTILGKRFREEDGNSSILEGNPSL